MQSSDNARPEKRSPLKDRPLPQAGEALADELHNRRLDILYWGTATIIVFAVCLEEWVKYLAKSPPAPFFSTAALLVVAVIAGRKVLRIRRTLPQLELGMQGERIVGEKLDSLRSEGYRVFHDIQGDGFNIDHLIIGPEGVFSIETKTHSKSGNERVTFDGERVLIDGIAPDRDPVAQSLAAARSVRAIIKEQTGSDVSVKPVVLYPGWYVRVTARNPSVLVACDNYFINGRLRDERDEQLSPDKIEFLAAALERHCRR